MRAGNEYRQLVRPNGRVYKHQPAKDKRQTLMMFISIFFVLLLIFLGFAKIMSPDVDIAIGEDNVTNEQYTDNTEYYRAGNVDRRLKALQAEDDAEPEDDGLVKIPEKTAGSESEPEEKTEILLNKEDITKHESVESAQELPAETAVPVQVQSTPVQTITARVVVGFYNTQAQADVAKGILQESGLGVTPHIRPLDSGYTLQVGAYSSKEAANNLANKLLMNNYPARVIVE